MSERDTKKSPPEPTLTPYEAEIDHGLTLEEAIKASGCGTRRERFIVGDGASQHELKNVILEPSDQGKCSARVIVAQWKWAFQDADEVNLALASHNLQPASMRELLAFITRHPELLDEYPILATRTLFPNLDSDANVPGVSLKDGKPCVHLYTTGALHSGCRYLALEVETGK